LCAVGGYTFRPNFVHAAEIVLRHFREGLLGRFNLDTDLLKKDCVSDTMHNSAVATEASKRV